MIEIIEDIFLHRLFPEDVFRQRRNLDDDRSAAPATKGPGLEQTSSTTTTTTSTSWRSMTATVRRRVAPISSRRWSSSSGRSPSGRWETAAQKFLGRRCRPTSARPTACSGQAPEFQWKILVNESWGRFFVKIKLWHCKGRSWKLESIRKCGKKFSLTKHSIFYDLSW